MLFPLFRVDRWGMRPEEGSFLPRGTRPIRVCPRTQDSCLFLSPHSTLPQGSRSGCELDASWLKCRCLGGFQTLEVFSPTRPLISQHIGALLRVHIGHCGELDNLRTFGSGSGACQRWLPSPSHPTAQRHLELLCTLESILGTLEPFLGTRKLQPLEEARTGCVSGEVWLGTSWA